jgi:dTDP-4-dehydrorhamnose 3,5-epimerase-like enzyme
MQNTKKKLKGWNYHKKLFSLIAVPYGKVKFTFAEDIKKRKKIIIIGKKNYSLIVIPPGLWFKFESLTKFSLIINTLNDTHKSSETLKIPIISKI